MTDTCFAQSPAGKATAARRLIPWPTFGKARRDATTAAKPARDELPPQQGAQACLATARELESRGYRREAILLYVRARSLDPSLSELCRRLAVLYDLEGAHTEAWNEYQRALELSPDDADLLNDVGYFHYQRGDLAAAERWLLKALQKDPEHDRAATNLGLVLGHQGRYQESFEVFAQVVGPAAAHSNVGMILAKHGRRDEAIRALRQAVTLDPSLRPAFAMLAYLENPDAGQPPQPLAENY
jgi:Flp pilus assembly protein TadD